MTSESIDRIVRRHRWYMLSGALVFGLPYFVLRQYGYGAIGILSGPLLVMLGAMGGALWRWKSECGLWMGSALFLLPSLAFYGFFGWMELATFFPLPRNLDEICGALDLSLATYILWKQVRFLASAGYYNWMIGRIDRKTERKPE